MLLLRVELFNRPGWVEAIAWGWLAHDNQKKNA
jgi:hypothetical protein